MRDTTSEWRWDWYGFNKPEDQTDLLVPNAPAIGKFKVVRSGKIDDDIHIHLLTTSDPHIDAAYYHRSTNRVSLPPAFGFQEIKNADIGNHTI